MDYNQDRDGWTRVEYGSRRRRTRHSTLIPTEREWETPQTAHTPRTRPYYDHHDGLEPRTAADPPPPPPQRCTPHRYKEWNRLTESTQRQQQQWNKQYQRKWNNSKQRYYYNNRYPYKDPPQNWHHTEERRYYETDGWWRINRRPMNAPSDTNIQDAAKRHLFRKSTFSTK